MSSQHNRIMKQSYALALLLVLTFHCQFLFADSKQGQIIGWGSNIARQAKGIGTSDISTGFVIVAEEPLSNIVAIAAGAEHFLALRADGTIVAGGFNFYGQTTIQADLTNVVAVAAGGNHSLALRKTGKVVAWGDNQNRQASVPDELRDVTAIAAGWIGSLALKKDSTVIGWGAANVPIGLSNVVAIAATSEFYGHDLALKNDGTVVEWGARGVNSKISVKTGLSNVVTIAAGANHSLALKTDGTVFGWGDNSSGQATGIATKDVPNSLGGMVIINDMVLSNIVAIAAGNEFSLALKKEGTVVAWGKNNFHQTDVPAGLSNIVAIAAGPNFCLAITTNSTAAPKHWQK